MLAAIAATSMHPPTGNFAKACARCRKLCSYRTISHFVEELHWARHSVTDSSQLFGFVERLVSARFAKVRRLQDRPALHLLCWTIAVAPNPLSGTHDARARMHARRVVQATIPSAHQCKQLVVSGISDDAATARSCPFSHVALHEVHAAQHNRREMSDVHRTPSAPFLQCKSPLPLHSAPQRCVDESSDGIHENSKTPTR